MKLLLLGIIIFTHQLNADNLFIGCDKNKTKRGNYKKAAVTLMADETGCLVEEGGWTLRLTGKVEKNIKVEVIKEDYVTTGYRIISKKTDKTERTYFFDKTNGENTLILTEMETTGTSGGKIIKYLPCEKDID